MVRLDKPAPFIIRLLLGFAFDSDICQTQQKKAANSETAILYRYMALTATFTVFFLLEDFMRMLTFKNFRRSFWNPYSLVQMAFIPCKQSILAFLTR